MSYTIEQISEMTGGRLVGNMPATVDWLLTDSRSLSFPEATLFFALATKRNDGMRYVPELYVRGVRNFVVSEEAFDKMKSGVFGGICQDANYVVVGNTLKALQR